MELILFLVPALAGYFGHYIFHRNQRSKYQARISKLDLQIKVTRAEIFELRQNLMPPVSFFYGREKMN